MGLTSLSRGKLFTTAPQQACHWISRPGMGHMANTGCKGGGEIQYGIFNLVRRKQAKRKGVGNSC